MATHTLKLPVITTLLRLSLTKDNFNILYSVSNLNIMSTLRQSDSQTTISSPSKQGLDRIDGLLTPYAHYAGTVLRIGLGVSFLLGGGYKILRPVVYQAYLAPLLASVWPTSLISLHTVFIIAGICEVAFGLLLLANWHTPTIAGLTVPWLIGTNVNFLIAIAQGESSADLLALYVGLMMMAAGVALYAARQNPSPIAHD